MKNVINYSDKTYEIYNYFSNSILNEAEIVVLPDINPGKAPLPTGSVVVFDIENNIEEFLKYTVSDIGCGMFLAKSSLKQSDFSKQSWDNIARTIKAHKGKLGDLGSGNHFLDAMVDTKTDELYFLCHTGSRDESKKIQALVNNEEYKEFHDLYTQTRAWANENRNTIIKFLEKEFGSLETIVHNDHNHYEIIDHKLIIRKGAVKVLPGEKTIIPSHMTGEAIVVSATENISKTFNSLSHGTGRVMSRSDAKDVSFDFDKELREKIYIPEMIKNESLRTESPFVYRDIDTVIELLDDLIEVETRLRPIAYIGQL